MKKVIILSTALVLAFGIAQIGYTWCANNDYGCRMSEALERQNMNFGSSGYMPNENEIRCDRALRHLQIECSLDSNSEECASARRIYNQMRMLGGC